MALFVRQDENRSKLQEKLAAELRERAKKNGGINSYIEGIEETEYMKGTKQTTSLAWVWAIIVLATIGIVIWLLSIGKI
jgi:hypothetical protein